MTTLLFLCDGLEQNIVTILKTLYCEPVVKVLEMGQYSSVLLPPYCYLKQPSSIGKSLGSWNKCVTLLLERKVFRRFRIIFGMARRKLRQSFVLAIFWVHSVSPKQVCASDYICSLPIAGEGIQKRSYRR